MIHEIHDTFLEAVPAPRHGTKDGGRQVKPIQTFLIGILILPEVAQSPQEDPKRSMIRHEAPAQAQDLRLL